MSISTCQISVSLPRHSLYSPARALSIAPRFRRRFDVCADSLRSQLSRSARSRNDPSRRPGQLHALRNRDSPQPRRFPPRRRRSARCPARRRGTFASTKTSCSFFSPSSPSGRKRSPGRRRLTSEPAANGIGVDARLPLIARSIAGGPSSIDASNRQPATLVLPGTASSTPSTGSGSTRLRLPLRPNPQHAPRRRGDLRALRHAMSRDPDDARVVADHRHAVPLPPRHLRVDEDVLQLLLARHVRAAGSGRRDGDV